jgi:LPS sulfotransferase NodH
LFRDADKIGWDIESYVELFEASNLCSLREQDPAGFLEHVFNMFAPRVRAVGFKIFYFHAESNKALWQYLQRQTEMKVIHLRRWNGLRRLLSLKKAFVTNRWFDSRGIEEKPLSVHLDYDECLNEFQLAAETSEKFDSYFCAHPCHELVYESLVSDYQKEMISVTKFLEVRFEHLRSDTYKQSNQPLEKAISNYFELKDAFRNSPWQVFFDDH